MAKRKDSQNALNTPPADGISHTDLPPDRPRKKALTRVDAPLTNLSLNNLIYIMSLGAVVLIAWYCWRIVGYKREVGGWWNLALGKKAAVPEPTSTGWFSNSKNSGTGEGSGGGDEVEQRINALASALGMPPTHLASAIASAVREHVPPASLSSVAASEPTGSATKILVNDESEEEAEGQEGVAATAGGILGSVVGMDEPPEA